MFQKEFMKVTDSLLVPFGKDGTVVHGGPYHARHDGSFGVKMAVEIELPCDVSVPTHDFSVPDEMQLIAGLKATIWAMAFGKEIYVGCMGGTGRTGLFLAALVKALGVENPVQFVREGYRKRAVETREQELFIKKLDVSKLKWHVRFAKVVASVTRHFI